ncbi:MAG: hypothetical protein AMXMBFR20_25960 [Planctomycetia bacterium]|nr:MAG: hypothetical protein B6D36_09890 [Planctomycetes bacterium UTPLA1]
MRGILLRMSAILALGVCGCGDIEWNWDWAWWKKPERVVRPVRQADAPRRDQADRSDEAHGRPSGAASTSANAAQSPPSTVVPSAEPIAANSQPLPNRPFYYLYFISGDAARDESTRGEVRIVLEHAPALACARLMEWLYVPTGRSGSTTESYAIYENAAEFRAAAAMAGSLDVAPAPLPISSVGTHAAFESGIAMLLGALNAGPGGDTKLAKASELRFVEALQSTDLPPIIRWASGILAGRVAEQYRYDHAGAKSYFKQAERLVPDGSIEKMTARWCRAEVLTQEGKSSDAILVYQEIIEEFGKANADSHIVRRATALIDEYNKR